MQENLNELVKAELTHLDSLETVTVDWNPNKYSVSKHRELVAAGAPGGGAVRRGQCGCAGEGARISTTCGTWTL